MVVISGCSCGGKTTLLAELSRRGYEIVQEPGRRIVTEQLASGGEALPWRNAEAFATRAVETSLADLDRASHTAGWIFFDRGLVDAVAALSHLTGVPVSHILGVQLSYHRQVFMTPPWPEIYVNDSERRHRLDDAIEEYERLVWVYPSLGYELTTLPKTSVEERADFMLEMLGI